jgi:hypothetical protein
MGPAVAGDHAPHSIARMCMQRRSSPNCARLRVVCMRQPRGRTPLQPKASQADARARPPAGRLPRAAHRILLGRCLLPAHAAPRLPPACYQLFAPSRRLFCPARGSQVTAAVQFRCAPPPPVPPKPAIPTQVPGRASRFRLRHARLLLDRAAGKPDNGRASQGGVTAAEGSSAKKARAGAQSKLGGGSFARCGWELHASTLVISAFLSMRLRMPAMTLPGPTWG